MSVDEVYKEQDYACCAHSVDVLVGVHVVKRHEIVDVQCVLVVNVVINVHIVVLSVPLVVVHFVVPIFLVVILCQFIQLCSRSHSFTYIFTVFSRHFRCGIYTPRRLQ